MKFDKKTIIIVASSIVGFLLLCGIGCFAFHENHEGRNEGKFGQRGGRMENCENGFARGNQLAMLSGMATVISTKDYAGFQKLMSGNKLAETVNTPEKFATRVELQTTIQKTQDLQNQLGSGSTVANCPMMHDQGGEGRPMMKGNMMRR